jgi:hypothetical protein
VTGPKLPEGVVSENRAAQILGMKRATLVSWRRKGWLRPEVLVDLGSTGRGGRVTAVGYREAVLRMSVLRDDALAFIRPNFIGSLTPAELAALNVAQVPGKHEDLGDADVASALAEAVAVSVPVESNNDIIQLDPETASFGDVTAPGVLVDGWATGLPALEQHEDDEDVD